MTAASDGETSASMSMRRQSSAPSSDGRGLDLGLWIRLRLGSG